MRRGLFFFFFFCFTLSKTTEICFGSTKMGIFYQEKAGIMTAPLKNIPLTSLEGVILTSL